jgi:putative SOS response-associated peptidase YedK
VCGRYTLTNPEGALAEALVEEPTELRARYNVAPAEPVLAVRLGRDGERKAVTLRWGLIPPGASDPQVGARMINARAETVATKPVFRWPLLHRRCLILADGFYEWRRERSHKQPYLFRLEGGRTFAFAGIWTRWQGPREPIASCSIITTSANRLVSPIHDRMPSILLPDHYCEWLRAPDEENDAGALLELLRPLPSEGMVHHAVSPAVNRAGQENPSMVEPYDASARPENLSLF